MQLRLAILTLLLGSASAYSQKFVVRGTVTDSTSGALPSATVMLLNAADSSLVNFGVSDARGTFEIKNVNAGRYLLKISFVGYVPYSKPIETPASGAVLELGTLKLQVMTKELETVVVKGDIPVVVKRDTIEYNAASFKTKANANVEDMLKKMPGIDVETDGSIKAQGEDVQRVTVDGREFFGRDPKLATRNLPADAVDKVQVFDKKSDQATFTGIDDGQREKTINLELKEEKRNGAFGTLMGGLGTDDRFQARASINRFSKGKQLSFLGMGNNVNEQGFSMDDYMNFSGGSTQMMGGGGRVNITVDNSSGVPMNFGGRQNGIVTNWAGGVNFNQDLSKKTKVTASYFFSSLDQDLIQSVNRINYLPQGSYTLNQDSRQQNLNDNHRVNFILEHQIDSANSIKFTSNMSYTDSEQRLTSQSETLTDTGVLQNESDRTTFNSSQNGVLNADLLYRHRFPKKGRSLSTTLTLRMGLTDSEGNLQSDNVFYGAPGEVQNLLQTNTTDNDNQSYGAVVSYTEPLGGRKYLEANYNFRTNRNDVNREVYDQETGSPVFNPGLSNIYNSDYIFNKPSLNFRINRQKFNVTAGVGYQMTRLKGDLEIQNATIDRSFENVLPVVHFNYDFSSFKHLRLDYETSMQEPGIQQLSPVVDNSDPLNLYVGNPNLKPAYMHRAMVNYTFFDPGKFINFFAFVNATYTENAITNSQTVNQDLVRLTTPVNMDFAQNLNGNFNFGFPIQKLKSRFNLGPTVTQSRNATLLNLQEQQIDQYTYGGNARYNFNFKDIVILDLNANVSRQITDYEFDTQTDQTYLNQRYGSELNLTFLKKNSLNTTFDYFVYDSETNDFSQSIALFNVSLSRFLFKANAGELKITAYNLLDQDLSVQQTATANYLQQTTTNNLGRYLMLSFTYALNKQLNPMGGRRPGGMRMMMIRD
jgi:hypothetical protein